MKLYAVVIGRSGRDSRYVSLHPDRFPDRTLCEYPLAVYKTRKKARGARHLILSECNHRDVHVIVFNGPEK